MISSNSNITPNTPNTYTSRMCRLGGRNSCLHAQWGIPNSFSGERHPAGDSDDLGWHEILDPKLALQFKAAMPRCTVSYVEDCGHVPHVEQPEQAAHLLVEFINKHVAMASLRA